MSKKKLTHYDDRGNVKMVSVTEKSDTTRRAAARGFIRLSEEVLKLLEEGNLKKGDPLEAARIAGIMAAKKTHELIPLCHPLQLTAIDISFQKTRDGISIESEVVCVGKTGVEMEALTAVSVAALTIYDMCKAIDKEMILGDIFLVEKSGGKSGNFRHPSADEAR